MAYLDDLKTARDNLAAKIATVTADPKPSYSIDGQSVSHSEYLSTLITSLENIQAAISRSEVFVIKSQVV